MSTFSLFQNGATATSTSMEAGSASGTGSLKPKSVRSGRADANWSGFPASVASMGASTCFSFFALVVRQGGYARRKSLCAWSRASGHDPPWSPPPCRPLHRGTPRHRTWRGPLLCGVPSHHSIAGGPHAPLPSHALSDLRFGWEGGRGGFGAVVGQEFRGHGEISEDGDDSWGGDGGGGGMEHGWGWKGRGRSMEGAGEDGRATGEADGVCRRDHGRRAGSAGRGHRARLGARAGVRSRGEVGGGAGGVRGWGVAVGQNRVDCGRLR
jgi:hypothetical protein